MLEFEMRNGPNKKGLQNRKRIWKLVDDLVRLVHATLDPDRILYGQYLDLRRLDSLNHSLVPHFTTSCLAPKYRTEDYLRQLTKAFSTFDNASFKSRLLSITPSYVRIFNKRLISGLSFQFSDSRTIDVGYINERQKNYISSITYPKVLWIVSSQLGFEAISLDTYPHQYLQNSSSSHTSKVAIARWTLENLRSVCLGLDVSFFRFTVARYS